MARDIVKLRRVGDTLVVTLTHAILGSVEVEEGDRLVLEAVPPRRVIITKEVDTMPSTQRMELEIEALQARKEALDLEAAFVAKQYNTSMPLDEGMDDFDIVDLTIAQLNRDKARIASEIAQKRVDLFELQGA